MLETIKSIPFTFFSSTFYRDLMRQGKGIGISFILVLTLIDLGYLIAVTFSPGQKFIATMPEITATLPTVTFKDHKLSIDQPSPYIIKLPEEKLVPDVQGSPEKTRIVIDTTYVASDLNALNKKMKDESIIILFTADQMITFKGEGRELRIQSYESFPDTVITHELWMQYTEKAQVWLPVVIFVVFAISMFVFNFVKILSGGFFAMLVGFFSKSVPDYAAALRLAGATAIPVAIIFLIVPTQGVVKLLLWFVYMIFGAVCARRGVANA